MLDPNVKSGAELESGQGVRQDKFTAQQPKRDTKVNQSNRSYLI